MGYCTIIGLYFDRQKQELQKLLPRKPYMLPLELFSCEKVPNKRGHFFLLLHRTFDLLKF